MSLPQSDPTFAQSSGLVQPTPHSHTYIPSISLQDPSLQIVLSQVQDLRTQLDRSQRLYENSQRLYEDSQRKQEGLTERLFTIQDKLVEAEKEVGELKVTVERLSKVRPQVRLETPSSGESSRMQSLAPSDSISQVPVPTHSADATRSVLPTRGIRAVRSSKRPQDLPFEVLWNLEDCRLDSDAAPKGSNASRPPMNFAIRKCNGAFITGEEYSDIRKFTATLVHANLACLETPKNNPLLRSRASVGFEKRSISWYKTFYPARLAEVIEQLEGTFEELKLCSGHWKAEHVLMQHLNSLNATNQRKFGTIQKDEEGDEGKSPEKGKGKGQGKGKQRARSLSSDFNSHPASVLRRSSSPSSQITINKLPTTESQHDDPPQVVSINATKRVRSDTLDTTTQAAKRLRIGDKGNELPSAHDLIQSTFHIGLQQPDAASINNSLGVGASTVPVDNAPSLEAQFDIGFIYVNPSLKTLNNIFTNDFPLLKTATALISILTNLAASENNPPEPSNDVAEFISRIENADPNCPNLADDDNNAGWGHHQFTAGSQTVASVLTSWEAVGNVATACRLIAAAIKTCQVARYICLQRNIQANSYMSDAYLDRVVDTLTDLARSQVPECPTNTLQVETSAVSTSLRDGPAEAPTTNSPLAPSSATLFDDPKPPQRNALQALLVDDLKTWIRTHEISLPNRNAKKAELIDVILSSTHIPSKDEIQSLVGQRKGKKGAS